MNTLHDSRQSLCFISFSFSFSELDDVKGIPEFWLTAMKNVDMLAEMIQVCMIVFSHQVCHVVFLMVSF